MVRIFSLIDAGVNPLFSSQGSALPRAKRPGEGDAFVGVYMGTAGKAPSNAAGERLYANEDISSELPSGLCPARGYACDTIRFPSFAPPFGCSGEPPIRGSPPSPRQERGVLAWGCERMLRGALSAVSGRWRPPDRTGLWRAVTRDAFSGRRRPDPSCCQRNQCVDEQSDWGHGLEAQTSSVSRNASPLQPLSFKA